MIPKFIYQTWYTTTLHPKVQNEIDKMLKLNPEYKHKIYTDEEMDTFVKEHYSGEVYECFNKLNKIVAKADFWRYLILYKFGGIYLDIDSIINCSLEKLIKEDDEAIISAENNPGVFLQWCLIFNKEHPILKKTIEIVVDNIKSNKYPNDVVRMTGPLAFTEAINNIHKSLFNNNIDLTKINKTTDLIYEKDNCKYKFFKVDFDGLISFKHSETEYLYNEKPHWTTIRNNLLK